MILRTMMVILMTAAGSAAHAQAAFSFDDKPVPKIDCTGLRGMSHLEILINLREADETGESSMTKMMLLQDGKLIVEYAAKDLRTGLVASESNIEPSSGLESVVVANFYQGSGLKGLVYLRGPAALAETGHYMLTMSIPSANLSDGELPMTCENSQGLP